MKLLTCTSQPCSLWSSVWWEGWTGCSLCQFLNSADLFKSFWSANSTSLDNCSHLKTGPGEPQCQRASLGKTAWSSSESTLGALAGAAPVLGDTMTHSVSIPIPEGPHSPVHSLGVSPLQSKTWITVFCSPVGSINREEGEVAALRCIWSHG